MRSTKNAGGATTKLKNDISGSCSTIRDERDQRQEIAAERGDQQVDDLRAGGGAGRKPRDEFGRVPVGKEAQAFAEQLGEHGALIVGDDAVADTREHHRVAVGRDALDGEQERGDGAEHDDARQVLVDVSLIDDVADQIGAERGAGGGDRHEGESDRVLAPMHQALLGQQAPDQCGGAIARVGGR